MTMNIYFVRHGESELNATRTHQNAHTKLSARGHEQARAVAKRFARIPLDVVITSDFTRAHETAQTIVAATGHKLITNELFRELKRPSEIGGMLWDSHEAIKIKQDIDAQLEKDPTYHYSDEENFLDITKRAQNAWDYLIALPHNDILVVSYGIFLRYMFGVGIYSNDYDERLARHHYNIQLENTGISKFEYKDSVLRLIMWNDHAHFG